MRDPEARLERGPRRREPSDLFATILEVVKRHRGRARITRISYGAGMPVDRLQVAIARLVTTGLLSAEEEDGHTNYDVTARGQEFLDTYWRMRGYLEGLEGAGSSPPAGRGD